MERDSQQNLGSFGGSPTVREGFYLKFLRALPYGRATALFLRSVTPAPLFPPVFLPVECVHILQ